MSLPRPQPSTPYVLPIRAFAILLAGLLCMGLVTASLIAQTKSAESEVAAEAEGFDPTGDWLGALEVQGVSLRLVFHVERSDDGLTATLDSVDQGANGIPVSSVTFVDGTLTAKIQAVGGGYEGILQEDGTLEGTWTQGALSLPLKLERQTEPVVLHRPQEPKEPFPYRSEEVTFENQKAGVTLAGTLTLPEGQGPFPGAILISGSGPQDRDESLMGHRPFLVLADHLTRQGIAVLRYDDRGTAQSTGDFGAADSRDFADDTRAAVAWMKGRSEISTIGLVGHSEGGLIAPMVALDTEAVDYLVLLAGPAQTGREVMLEQTERLFKARDMETERRAELRELQAELFDRILTGASEEKIHEALSAVIDLQSGGVLSEEDRRAQAEIQAKQLTSPWFRYFLAYDPAPTLAEVKQPVLAINGAKDFQVPSEIHLPAIAAALKSGGNEHFETMEMEGLNHLFQTSVTGMLDEYAKTEETFAPVALEKISSWILSVVEPSDTKTAGGDAS